MHHFRRWAAVAALVCALATHAHACVATASAQIGAPWADTLHVQQSICNGEEPFPANVIGELKCVGIYTTPTSSYRFETTVGYLFYADIKGEVVDETISFNGWDFLVGNEPPNCDTAWYHYEYHAVIFDCGIRYTRRDVHISLPGMGYIKPSGLPGGLPGPL